MVSRCEGRDERCKDAKKRDHVKMVVDKASLPPNTVQGLRSVVVPVEGGCTCTGAHSCTRNRT